MNHFDALHLDHDPLSFEETPWFHWNLISLSIPAILPSHLRREQHCAKYAAALLADLQSKPNFLDADVKKLMS